MKKFLIKLHWIASSQLGFNPLLFIRAIKGFPLYLIDFIRFRRKYQGRLAFMPCLHDRYEESGATNNEYFVQDLLVARAIYETKPIKHVDIGSRVDGFVAHVASFREIEVFDVRPISSVVPGVVFRQADLMNANSLPTSADGGYCDSLSCLHAIEHFGLGRYGDPVNPNGYQQGIANMAQILKPGGAFYLSTPIGYERVEFNANWVFDPRSIVHCAVEADLLLQKLIIITQNSGPREVPIDDSSLSHLSLQRYQLGLFFFKKSTFTC